MSGASSAPRVEEIVLEKTAAGLGFNIRGGTDNMHVGNDPGIFVTTIRPAGAAAVDGRLHTGDKILELNREDLREVPHKKAVSAFHKCGSVITLLVEKGAEQRIRDEMQAQSSPNNPDPPGEDERQELVEIEERPVESRLPRPVVVVLQKWRWWVPVLVGAAGVGLLVFYVRRRPDSLLSRFLTRPFRRLTCCTGSSHAPLSAAAAVRRVGTAGPTADGSDPLSDGSDPLSDSSDPLSTTADKMKRR